MFECTEARRHVNKMCLAGEVPLVESGTSGLLGQTTVHLNVMPNLARNFYTSRESRNASTVRRNPYPKHSQFAPSAAPPHFPSTVSYGQSHFSFASFFPRLAKMKLILQTIRVTLQIQIQVRFGPVDVLCRSRVTNSESRIHRATKSSLPSKFCRFWRTDF